MADGDRDERPYARYAFHNLYNYTLMGAVGAVALVSGTWIPLVVGAGLEALWMLNAPGSRLLRRLWFDRVHAERTRAQEVQRRQQALAALPEAYAGRVRALEARRDRILELADQNPSFTVELLRPELGKLERLVDGFIDLATSHYRYASYLESVDWNQLEREIRRWSQAVEQERDPLVRRTAQKNLEVLMQRREKLGQIRGYVSGARAQLDLIENTFRLIGDQILTMTSPSELGGQLDELIDGVEAVRSVASERELLMQAQ